jgi:hypothetical protein
MFSLMSARIALPIVLLAASAALLPRPAAAGPWGLAPGEWYSRIEGSVFSTSTFYLDGGARSDTSLVVEQRALSSYNELGWKRGMTFFFNLPAMSVTRRDDLHPMRATATGFQDILVGIRFRLLEGRTPMALELAWSGPLGYNRNLDSLGLQLGDGLQQATIEFHVGRSLFGRGFVQASGGRGYRYLGTGGLVRASYPYLYAVRQEEDSVLSSRAEPEKWVWSDRLFASADLGVWVGPSLLVGGRYRGFVTLSHGPLAPDVNLHLAGPVLLYRLDDRLDMYAGSWSTTAGRNTFRFNQVYVGVAFHKTKLDRLQGFLGGKQAP